MPEPLTIMLVDDNDRLRRALRRPIAERGYRVVDFASGEEAVLYASQKLGMVSVVFIDHVLHPEIGGARNWDGIETTRRLMQLDPNLCIVVFSGQPDISEADRRKAREAGARRYVYKEQGIEITRIVLDFIHEVETLRELRELTENVRQQRERIVATLRETPVGTLLLDKAYFPWVVSDTWRRIEEKLDAVSYPDHRFADFLVADPFRKRLVDEALAGTEVDDLALRAVHHESLKYLHVWARPIRNAQRDVIACSLSMVDQTASHVVKKMSLRQRLGLIAQAILRAGYDRARFYKVSNDGKCLVGVTEEGDLLNIPHFEGFEIPITRVNYLMSTIAERRPRYWSIREADSYFRAELGKTSDFINYPLFEQEQFLGMLTVDREIRHKEFPLTEADVPRLTPYAQEARKAFLEAPQGQEQHDQNAFTLDDVWAEIDRCHNPTQAMDVVLKAVQRLTGCDMAHIRIRQANQAVMVAQVGAYPQHRPKAIALDTMFWSVHVMKTGRPIIVNDISTVSEDLFQERKTWTPETAQAFSKAKAFAVFPLPYGEIVGAMVVLGPNVNHFASEERRQTLQRLARLAATAWVDLHRAQEQDRQHAALQNLALTTVHNLRQPITALRGPLERILRKNTQGTLTAEYAVEATHDALRYLERSENIITDIPRYLKPLKPRRRVVRLRTLIQPIAEGYEKVQASLHIGLNVSQEITVWVDEELLRQVFEELFHNAAKATHGRCTVRVHASFTQLTHDSGRAASAVRIVVEDDGPGVTAKVVSKLFEPFVTGFAQGTGLGLAFVKRVIEEHGGHIQYESAVPQGARFIFFLPAEESVNGT